jgi:ADP-ribose pyrophosphatase YjhB (NUDIX family)
MWALNYFKYSAIVIINYMQYKLILVSIIHRNNKSELLLVRRNREPGYGQWSLPGGTGALEREPDPELAISAEVFGDFETNILSPKLFRLKYTADPEPTLHLYFHGKLEGEPKIKSVKTIKEIKWIAIENIAQIDLAFKNVDLEIIEKFKAKFKSH